MGYREVMGGGHSASVRAVTTCPPMLNFDDLSDTIFASRRQPLQLGFCVWQGQDTYDLWPLQTIYTKF